MNLFLVHWFDVFVDQFIGPSVCGDPPLGTRARTSPRLLWHGILPHPLIMLSPRDLLDWIDKRWSGFINLMVRYSLFFLGDLEPRKLLGCNPGDPRGIRYGAAYLLLCACITCERDVL